ncbi:unnamed protein product [Polarella glacialis]|uniref:Uncharacterized protein n=1 Tax=Polarella glacialis TaxID=89957 RepID=A0A813LKL5_POLGL|nr:unnamed protein product [Polarella glacialis]CAE8730237.1 unnamed protein product [Polarella glacialis]
MQMQGLQGQWGGYGWSSGGMTNVGSPYRMGPTSADLAYAAAAAATAGFCMNNSFDAYSAGTVNPSNGVMTLNVASCLDAHSRYNHQMNAASSDVCSGMNGGYSHQGLSQHARAWLPPGNFNVPVAPAGVAPGVASITAHEAMRPVAEPSASSAQFMAARPPVSLAPALAPSPAPKPPPAGMSFGELEARLQSSWESLPPSVAQAPSWPSSEEQSLVPSQASGSRGCFESLTGSGFKSPSDRRASSSQAAPAAAGLDEEPAELRIETSPDGQTAAQQRVPLKAFCKEGLFCPCCAERSSCPFHGEQANQDLESPLHVAVAALVASRRDINSATQAVSSAPSLVALRAAVAVPFSPTQPSSGACAGSSKVEDSGEDSSTEANSSEPWYGSSSDGWSDVGDWSGSVARSDAVPAAGIAFFSEDTSVRAENADITSGVGAAGNSMRCSSPSATAGPAGPRKGAAGSSIAVGSAATGTQRHKASRLPSGSSRCPGADRRK